MRSCRIYNFFAGCIILLAFFLRLYRIETISLDYDNSYAHGVGIQLLDALRQGTFGSVALHGQPSGLLWPNPVVANYVMAAISVIDRSPAFAFLIVAMSSVLSTAFTIAIVQALCGKTTALFAGLAAATSPWLVLFARSPSQLGIFELAQVAPACLLWWAIMRRKRGLSGLAVVISAFSAQVYIVAFGIMAQMGASIALMAALLRRWRLIATMGVFVFALGVGAYVAVLLNADPQFFSNPHIRLNYSSPVARSTTNDAWLINPDAFIRSFNLISGGEFPEQATTRDVHLDAAETLLTGLRIACVSIAMLLGIIVVTLTRLHHPRFPRVLILLWFLIPVLFITVLTTVSRATPVSYYYLILATPTQAIFTGLGMNWIVQWLRAHKLFRVIVSITLCLVLLVPSLVAQDKLASALWTQSDPQNAYGFAYDLALGELQPLHGVWENQCAELTVPYNPFENRYELEYWAYGWTGDSTRVMPQTEVNLGERQTWAGSDERCTLRLSSQPAPPHAQVIARTTHTALYKFVPHPFTTPGVMTSIGWTLKETEIPTHLTPGQKVMLTFRWQIVSVPEEPHAKWQYDVFVKLLDANGNLLAQADIPSIPGRSWRQGIDVEQMTMLTVPQNAQGAGRLVISLYDRTQEATALFKSYRSDSVELVFPLNLGL